MNKNQDKQLLISELIAAGATKVLEKGTNAIMSCPFKANHTNGDQHPSGNVFMGDDGIYRYNCQSGIGCPSGDIHDLFPDKHPFKSDKMESKSQKSTKPKATYSFEQIKRGAQACYEYWDIKGRKILMLECRYGKDKPKPFCPYIPDGDKWVVGVLDIMPIYCGSPAHAKRIREADTVVIDNGCKSTQALHKMGVVATNKPCGESSPDRVDWSPLFSKMIIGWRDNDAVGLKYMNDVKELLMPHCKVKMIDPSVLGLGVKEDAYDFAEAHNWDKGCVRSALATAIDCGASHDVIQYVEDVIEGRIEEVLWPWRLLSKLTSSGIPGSTTLFVGGGGAGKSLSMTESICYWQDHDIPWTIYALESTRRLHLNRALAMRIGNSKITRMGWIRDNPALARQHISDNKDWLDEMGSHILVPPFDIGQEALAKWAEEEAKTKRIIIIDPISIANQDMKENGRIAKPWDSDRLFIKKTEQIMKESGASIINVSHPKGDGYHPALDNIKGSAAWPNFTHSVFWLEPIVEEEKEVLPDPLNDHIKVDTIVNRILHILKVREGECNTSSKIGMWFNKETLTMACQGLIVKEIKNKH